MELISTIAVALIGSGAMFGFLQFMVSRHDDKDKIVERVAELEKYQTMNYDSIVLLKNASKTQLGNSIFKTCADYLDRGDYVTPTELQNLESMFETYEALDGNSYAKDLMEQVRKLNIRSK